ncbi:MAG: barstar family protein [Burkholderiales bacterium]
MAGHDEGGGPGRGDWRVEFKGLRSRDSMLKRIASTMGFPAHFGVNLDALYDCLTDLQLAAGTDCIITLADLPHSPVGDAIHAAFADAAEFWRDRGVAMRVVRD